MITRQGARAVKRTRTRTRNKTTKTNAIKNRTILGFNHWTIEKVHFRLIKSLFKKEKRKCYFWGGWRRVWRSLVIKMQLIIAEPAMAPYLTGFITCTATNCNTVQQTRRRLSVMPPLLQPTVRFLRMFFHRLHRIATRRCRLLHHSGYFGMHNNLLGINVVPYPTSITEIFVAFAALAVLVCCPAG